MSRVLSEEDVLRIVHSLLVRADVAERQVHARDRQIADLRVQIGAIVIERDSSYTTIDSTIDDLEREARCRVHADLCPGIVYALSLLVK